MKFLLLYYGLNKFLLNSYHRCLFLPSLQEKKTHLEGLLETHEEQYVNTPERFLGCWKERLLSFLSYVNMF